MSYRNPGVDPRLKIQAGGLTILGRPEQDLNDLEAGLFVTEGGFTGWSDTVEVRREAIARPGHGEYDLPVFLSSRVIAVEGIAVARSLDVLSELRDQLTGIGGDGTSFPIEVLHMGRQLSASARIGGQAMFAGASSKGPFVTAQFLWQLVCADPRKYGKIRDVTYATSGQVSHLGNFPASSSYEVRGSFPNGYTLSAAGRAYTVTESLTSGTDRIDMRTGLRYRNGVQRDGGVSRRQTWAIPHGVGVAVTLSAPSGSGSFRALTPDTYN